MVLPSASLALAAPVPPVASPPLRAALVSVIDDPSQVNVHCALAVVLDICICPAAQISQGVASVLKDFPTAQYAHCVAKVLLL